MRWIASAFWVLLLVACSTEQGKADDASPPDSVVRPDRSPADGVVPDRPSRDIPRSDSPVKTDRPVADLPAADAPTQADSSGNCSKPSCGQTMCGKCTCNWSCGADRYQIDCDSAPQAPCTCKKNGTKTKSCTAKFGPNSAACKANCCGFPM